MPTSVRRTRSLDPAPYVSPISWEKRTMSIHLSCSCGEQLEVRDEQVGLRVPCPACGSQLDVPGDATAIQPAPEARHTAPQRRPTADEGYDEDDDHERARAPTGTSGKAVASLILGVLSFCLPVVLGIPAIILGI